MFVFGNLGSWIGLEIDSCGFASGALRLAKTSARVDTDGTVKAYCLVGYEVYLTQAGLASFLPSRKKVGLSVTNSNGESHTAAV